MGTVQSRDILIPANSDFSEVINFIGSTLGISYIATVNAISDNTKLEMHIQSKLDPNVWLPLYNSEKKQNANVDLIPNKIIPCSPYIDGRGSRSIKFKIIPQQTNAVDLEIGFLTV